MMQRSRLWHQKNSNYAINADDVMFVMIQQASDKYCLVFHMKNGISFSNLYPDLDQCGEAMRMFLDFAGQLEPPSRSFE